MAFVKAISREGLWSGEMTGVVVEGRRVLLVNVGDEIHAYEDRCVHQAVPLSEGRLRGRSLICRAHAWEYDASTGEGRNPRSVQLRSFAVKVEGGDVLVDVQTIVRERSC